MQARKRTPLRADSVFENVGANYKIVLRHGPFSIRRARLSDDCAIVIANAVGHGARSRRRCSD